MGDPVIDAFLRWIDRQYSQPAPDAPPAWDVSRLCYGATAAAPTAGDGQVTVGQTIMKTNARKVRRLYQDRVLAGFAGAGADALMLFERFEAKLGQVGGNLRRAAVELAKDWRTDRLLRRLEALMVVADRES